MDIDSRAIHKLLSDVGEVKGSLRAMLRQIEKNEQKIANQEKRLDKVDVVFGKIGIVVVGVGFVAAFAFDLLRDLIASIFNR